MKTGGEKTSNWEPILRDIFTEIINDPRSCLEKNGAHVYSTKIPNDIRYGWDKKNVRNDHLEFVVIKGQKRKKRLIFDLRIGVNNIRIFNQSNLLGFGKFHRELGDDEWGNIVINIGEKIPDELFKFIELANQYTWGKSR